MKYFKLVGLIGLLTLFITGCSIDSQSPEQLIKDKPVYNEDKKIIYDGINQMLTRYTKLVVPLNSTERGSINEVDLNNDGKDEIFIGYDLVNHDGKILFSLPMNSDHTDEIIWARLNKKEDKKLVLASGNEGMNIVNLDGTIFKHNEIGHAQRISVAKYKDDIDGLQIMTTTFWGSDGIIAIFDHNGNKLKEFEQRSNGNIITPVNYDGKHVLSLLNSSMDGGLINGDLEKVVIFPNDGHPTLTCEVYDIDDDGIDEIICFDEKEMWIYKSKSYISGHKYNKYPDNGYSNYRGEYLIPYDYE